MLHVHIDLPDGVSVPQMCSKGKPSYTDETSNRENSKSF
jgi:hypothetical protein